MDSTIIYAIGVLSALGLLFGLVLALASKVFHVEQDERLAPLTAALPGANCGGCGFAGCEAYAKAVLAGEAGIGKCASGGSAAAEKMAAILGVEAVAVARQVAYVRCTGADRAWKADYSGIADCGAAMRLAGNGPLSCAYGCLGFGTCVSACQYDAIHIVDGRAEVDAEKCTGCLMCASACPRGVIAAVPYGAKTLVGCANRDKGVAAKNACGNSCIGCRLCERTCPQGAITVADNLAVIDYEKCTLCGACAEKCPRGAIHFDTAAVAAGEA